MKKWILTASRDRINVDFEKIIEADTEPGFWECYELADAAGCAFFSVDELEE